MSIDPRIPAFDRFVRGGEHPCVMARSVLARGAVRHGLYGVLGEPESARAVCRDLAEALRVPRAPGANWSFAAIFDGPSPRDESAFEAALWRQLQAMHDVDRVRHAWDPSVSDDPGDPRFSFSIAGCAFYVIGLHPAASRIARRFAHVAMVFNPHAQFERLRADGRYGKVKASIRERDRALQGSVNPMLADHGEVSEARQYAGRAVDRAWRCPLHVQR